MSNVSMPWVRSEKGVIFGVCQGLAERFEADVIIIRLAFVFLTLMGFSGFILYLAMYIGLPLESEASEAGEPKLFGVCARFARRFKTDVGVIRVLALLGLLFSAGSFFVVYFALYFILPTIEEMKS